MTDPSERLTTFAAALLDPQRAGPRGLVGPDGEPSARRFDVYRNNVFAGLIEALRAAFPCVLKLVGDEFFSAMARVFAAGRPPDSPVLLLYGTGFADFIESFVPAAGVPYLADVARIERAATEAYHEREATALSPDALACVPPERAPSMRLTLHPSVRLVSSRYPAFDIWRMNLPDGAPASVDLEQAQHTMVLRPEATVDVRRLMPASHDFVIALGRGRTLSQALQSAVTTDRDFDLSANLKALIQLGAIVAFDPGQEESHHE